MQRLLKKAVIAVVAASVLVVTTLSGLVVGIIGAFIRAQLPDSAMTEVTLRDASDEVASAATFVSHGTRPPTELHQPDSII